MYDSPITLKELCLDKICDCLEEVFDLVFDHSNNINGSLTGSNDSLESRTGRRKFCFKDPDLFLFNELSESLLLKLGQKKLWCNATLSLFSRKNTRLRNVKIGNARTVTHEGLKILREHPVVTLEVVNCRNMCVSQIIDCLSSWSIANIVELNVAKCTFIDTSRYCFMVVLTQLKMLRSLNVAYTEFNQETLKAVCEDLKCLERLDISGTCVNNFSPLVLLSEQLINLTVSDFRMTSEMVSDLIKLNSLRHFDLSIVNDKMDNSSNNAIVDILTNYNTLKNLVSLDISGWRNVIPIEAVEIYVTNHPKLKYLGLVLNVLALEPEFSDVNNKHYNHNLTVGGVGNESQIKVVLKKYYNKAMYIQKALYHLFQLSNTFKEARPDILELVLLCMASHPLKFPVQLAATACLYNLTKGDLSKNIHPSLLSKGVALTLLAMDQFPDEFQLQKNSLLTLCSDRILQDVSFDRFQCARLVLDSLCMFDESNMNRMAVAICSILAAKVSTSETSQLGARPKYMHKLLGMVKNRIEGKISDITMKFTLSALWNLTDESSATCEVFLAEGGALLFLEVLKTFRDDSAIETKVLGLLNNIAEVENLRYNLMLNELIEELYVLLKSELIDVSYFAAGIVAHLASDGADSWIINKYSRKEMLVELGNAVTQWKVPESEMVAYRSFKPFFPLLRREMDFQIQLWAVWAIHHVCTKNPARYCLMLKEEKGIEFLNDLLEDVSIHEEIRTIIENIMRSLKINF